MGRADNRRGHAVCRVDKESLARMHVLRPLPLPAGEELARLARSRQYARGEWISREEEPREPLVHGILSGRVQIELQSSEGEALPVRELGSGQLFVLEDLTAVAMDAVVARVLTSPTQLCELPQAAFDRVVIAWPEAARLLIAEQRGWIRVLGGLASDRLHKDPATRIRRTLRRETQEGDCATLRYTYEEIAAKACTNPVCATRVMSDLRREGIIHVDTRQHRIPVLHPERLTDDD